MTVIRSSRRSCPSGEPRALRVHTWHLFHPVLLNLRRCENVSYSRRLAATFVPASPERLIGDGAFDSNALDASLALQGIDLIAPHKSNAVNKTQDGRKLRRYKRRWKVERFFAWLYTFRHLVVRYDYKAQNYLAFVQLACILILLRYF
jgi:transposase